MLEGYYVLVQWTTYVLYKLAPTAAKLTVLVFHAISDKKGNNVFYHNTRREKWLGYCFAKNQTRFKQYWYKISTYYYIAV